MQVEDDDNDRLSALEVKAALDALSDADWKRLFRLAEYFHAFGLVGVTGEELIAETVKRLLDGTRSWKRGVDAVRTLFSIAQSIADHWRKRDEHIDRTVAVDHGLSESADNEVVELAQAVEARTPEMIVDGTEQLNQVLLALVGDSDAELLALSWADGVRGEDARATLLWDAKHHDAVRKRLGRKLESLRQMREKT